MIKATRKDKNTVEVVISGKSEDVVFEVLFLWVQLGIKCGFNRNDYIEMAIRAYKAAEEFKGDDVS